MQYTFLGKTGLSVSRICLGCMSYGSSKWRPWVLDEKESQPFFRKAVESGINFFDTADIYSMGVSEEVTGKALREMTNLEEIVLATKVRFPMSQKPNMTGLSRKHIVQGCEASLRRLGVDRIDLYQLHRLDANVPIEEVLEALDLLVRQGKILYVGCSTAWAWQFAQALKIADFRRLPRFVAMQNHYNLLYREEEREMIPLCLSEGVGIIPWSPLARGILAGTRSSVKDNEATERSKTDAFTQVLYRESDMQIVERVKEVAKDRDVQPAQIALAWLLNKPGVTAPIIGATKMDHLEAAIESVNIKLTGDEMKKLEELYEPHPPSGMFS